MTFPINVHPKASNNSPNAPVAERSEGFMEERVERFGSRDLTQLPKRHLDPVAASTSRLPSLKSTLIQYVQPLTDVDPHYAFQQWKAKIEQWAQEGSHQESGDLAALEIAKDRILEAAEQKNTSLSLSDLGIKQLPPETFSQLSALEKVDLKNNALCALPKSLFQLQNLKVLSLRNNELKTLSFKFSALHSLETLSVKDNPLGVFEQAFIGSLSIGRSRIGPSSLEGEGMSKTQQRRFESLASALRDAKFKQLPSKMLSLNQITDLTQNAMDIDGMAWPVVYQEGLFELSDVMQSWVECGHPGELQEILDNLYVPQKPSDLQFQYEVMLVKQGVLTLGDVTALLGQFRAQSQTFEDVVRAMYLMDHACAAGVLLSTHFVDELYGLICDVSHRFQDKPNDLMALYSLVKWCGNAALFDQKTTNDLIWKLEQIFKNHEVDQRLNYLEENQAKLFVALSSVNDRLSHCIENFQQQADLFSKKLHQLTEKQNELETTQEELIDTMITIGKRMRVARLAKTALTGGEVVVNAIPFVGPSVGALVRCFGSAVKSAKAGDFLGALYELKKLPSEVDFDHAETVQDLTLRDVASRCDVEVSVLPEYEAFNLTVGEVFEMIDQGKEAVISEQVKRIEQLFLGIRERSESSSSSQHSMGDSQHSTDADPLVGATVDLPNSLSTQGSHLTATDSTQSSKWATFVKENPVIVGLLAAYFMGFWTASKLQSKN